MHFKRVHSEICVCTTVGKPSKRVSY